MMARSSPRRPRRPGQPAVRRCLTAFLAAARRRRWITSVPGKNSSPVRTLSGSRSSSLSLPGMFELAASGPPAARAALGRARRLAAEREAPGWTRSSASRPAGSPLPPGTGRRGRGAGLRAGAGGGDRHWLDLAPGRFPVLHRRPPRPDRAGPGPAGVIPAPRPAAAVRA